MQAPMRHINSPRAFIQGVKEILHAGQQLTVRGSEILELRNHITIIDKPRERCITVPKRHNNIFATIAETAWVMAGRNDLDYLSYYLPRAIDFSDDGKTWRAAYGPRLRNWHGVDQLASIRRLLLQEQSTRRAVMVIFDPAADTQESKDIPCNNWLDWLIRDGKLNLSIAIRSNDAIWGFSGINSFEWSVLQEMLAYWVNVAVGDVTYFATSFHIYSRHIQRAAEIVSAFPGTTWYDHGQTSPPFTTSWENFAEMLERWFTIEAQLRTAPEAAEQAIKRFPDPLFGQFLAMLQLYNGIRAGWGDKQVAQCLSAMPENDLTAAAFEYCLRNRPAVVKLTNGHAATKIWLAVIEEAERHPSKQPSSTGARKRTGDK